MQGGAMRFEGPWIKIYRKLMERAIAKGLGMWYNIFRSMELNFRE